MRSRVAVNERERPLLLTADDDLDVLSLVAALLEQSGYDVVSARDGAEALTLVREQAPDLAILDVMMPKLDGYQVTRRIRDGGGATRRMPIILLTARVQDADVARGFEAGASEYMTKPFSPHDLRARVSSALNGDSDRRRGGRLRNAG